MYITLLLFTIVTQGEASYKVRWNRHIERWDLNTSTKPGWHDRFSLRDRMHNHEKQTLLQLMQQLMKSSDLKMRQVLEMRLLYTATIGFNIGVIIGKVRAQYRIMLDTYREAVDFNTDRFYHKPPGIMRTYHPHYYHYLEYIHRHENIIDNYIHVLENVPESEFSPNNIMISSLVAEKIKARRQENIDQEQINKVIAEQKLKQKVREKYLLKKLGMPTNMSTPKKRFINKWPVRKTWEENFEAMYPDIHPSKI